MIVWEIHYQILGVPGESVYHKKFHCKSVARRIAMQLFDDNARFKWWLVGTPLFGGDKIVENG